MSAKHSFASKILCVAIAFIMAFGVFSVIPFGSVAPVAQAATAGDYYVRFTYKITNKKEALTIKLEENYGGFNNNIDSSGGISIGYRGTNGLDDTIQFYNYDLKNMITSDGEHTVTVALSGFPVFYYGFLHMKTGYVAAHILELKSIAVSSSQNGSYTTLWSGNAHIESIINPYAASIDCYGSTKADYFDESDDTYVSTSSINWEFPRATSIGVSSTTTQSVTTPESNYAYGTNVSAVVYDQYGTTWYEDPHWALRTTNAPSHNSENISGVTLDNEAGDCAQNRVKVNSYAKDFIGASKYKMVYYNAYCADAYSVMIPVVIYAPQYTVTFYDTNSENVLKTQSVYYLNSATAPSNYTVPEPDLEGHYVFDGWSDGIQNITYDREVSPVFRQERHVVRETVVTPATCQADGVMRYTCESCGYSYTDSIPNIGVHVPGPEPTCTEPQTCLYCDYVFRQPLGHTFNAQFQLEEYVAEPATCLTKAKYYYVCSKCGAADTDTYEYGVALGHDYQSIVSDENISRPATCTAKATYYKSCSRCGVKSAQVFTAGNSLGHDWGEWVYDAQNRTHTRVCSRNSAHTESGECAYLYEVTTPATCLENGVGTYTCEVCGAQFTETLYASGTDHIPETIPAVDATCTDCGYTEGTKCSVCGQILDEPEYIEPLGHLMTGARETLVPATCLEGGTDTVQCSRCNYTETAATGALGHDYIYHSALAPTCTLPGNYAYNTCSRCSYSGYIEIPATGHTETVLEAVEPTCTETGLTAGKKCTVCNTVTEPQTVRDALGHEFGDWAATVEPGCLTKGTEKRSCTRCTYYEEREINALGHDYISHDAKTPTCLEDGYNAYQTCSRCDYSSLTVIPATGHTEEIIPAVAPSCLESGLSEGKKCTVCLEITVLQTVVPAAGHTETDIPEVPATCITPGATAGKKCSVCDTVLVEPEVITAGGHSFGSWQTVTAASCLTGGTEKRVCSLCSAVETRDTEALGHSIKTHSAKAPTCTAAGWDAYETCAYCDYSTFVELPANGHTETVLPAVAPTCTAAGKTEGVKCSVCGYVITPQKTVKATGHKYGEWTDNGDFTHMRVCENDPSHTETANCTYAYAGCLTSQTCTVCGSENGVIPGHKYTDSVTKNPTCTEAGIRTFTCSVCRDSYTEPVEKLGHDLVSHEAKAPTCTAKGYNAYQTCTRCSYSTYSEIPAKGHTPGAAATCTTAQKCTVCGATVKAALGHNYAVVSTTAPTCITVGEEVYTCTRCGDTHATRIETVRHSDGNGDGKCDYCGYDIAAERQANCTHLCHRTGFMGFIWKIINFFNKLFKINQYCECGAQHW